MFSFIFFYFIAFLLSMIFTPFDRARTAVYVLIALLLRLGASFLIPEVILFDDEYGYYLTADSIVTSLRHDTVEVWERNPWYNLTAVIFWVFGSSTYTMRPLSTLCGILSALLLARIWILAYGEKERVHAMRAYQMALFLPPFIFLSCLGLKEQAIAFFQCLLVWGFLRARLVGLLAAGLGFALVVVFRRDLAFVIAPLFAVHWVIRLMSPARYQTLTRALAIGTAFLVAGGIFYWGMTSTYTEELKLVMILKGMDTRGEETLRQSEATYASYLDLSSTSSLLNIIITPIISLYSPSPLRAFKSPLPEVYMEALALTTFIYLATPYFFIGLLRSFGSNVRMVVADFYLLGFGVSAYSLLTFAPEQFRYRWPSLGFFFLVALFGFVQHHPLRRLFVGLWWGSVAIFGYLYLR